MRESISSCGEVHLTRFAGALQTKRRIFALLFSDEIPSPEDAALIAMADACFVFERILAPRELAKVQYRIQQLCRLDRTGAQIHRSFTDGAVDATLFAEYRFTNTLGLNLTGKYTEEISSVSIPSDSNGDPYHMAYRKFEAYLGFRWFM